MLGILKSSDTGRDLRIDEMGSSDVLDVTVLNLGNLARQTIQHQAEPTMLRLITNQMSHIMLTPSSSDDRHHWAGVRPAHSDTPIKKLVDNCGSEHQKIWYTVFEVILGKTSKDQHVWKGGDKLMVVHVNHADARTACRSCRINFADLHILCAHFQGDFMGGDFNAFSYRYFRTGSQQIAASLQDSSLAVMLRRFDEGKFNAQWRDAYDTHPEYQFRSDLYMAYHDEHIREYRLKRDEITNEVTDTAGSRPRF